MEKIIQELNNKIREVAQNEELDIQKLKELVDTRDRLKSLSTTSIQQIPNFNQGRNVVNAYPIFQNNQPQNNSIYDSIQDIANLFLRNSQKQLENKSVYNLIEYHEFISKLEKSHDMDTELERTDTKSKLEHMIIKEIKNIMREKNNIENEKEKDKIIETSTELNTSSE